MSDKFVKLQTFIERWRAPLETRALVRFEAGPLPRDGLTPASKADAFCGQFGCKPIGFNWEMLDPGDDRTAPRSAPGTMVEALSSDIADRKTPWLGARDALQCALDFLAPFDRAALSVVTNQLNGLWYPVSGASEEWTFVAMDDAAIALLSLVPRV